MAGQFFSAAARTSALKARQARAVREAQAGHEVQVFVTRVDNRYGWEVRKFGGIALDTGSESFPSSVAARSAGQAALALRSERNVVEDNLSLPVHMDLHAT